MSIVKSLKEEHSKEENLSLRFSLWGQISLTEVSSSNDYTINTSNVILNHFTRRTTPDLILFFFFSATLEE